MEEGGIKKNIYTTAIEKRCIGRQRLTGRMNGRELNENAYNHRTSLGITFLHPPENENKEIKIGIGMVESERTNERANKRRRE